MAGFTGKQHARLLLCLILAAGAARAEKGVGLSTLTTARSAYRLPLEQARRGYPVVLRGVATYYDPFIDSRHGALFIQDVSGSIFVRVSSLPATPIPVGSLVEVRGVSGVGDFAPIIDQGKVRVIGWSRLPRQSPPVSMSELLTGKRDGQWVEIEGVVRSARTYGRNVDLSIAMNDGLLTATTISEEGNDYSQLVDARVRIRGNAAPIFNKNLQMTGARLLFPNLTQLTVKQPAPPDPFELPLLKINRLLSYTPNLDFRKRIHARGRVSLQWPNHFLCVQDATSGLCVQTSQSARLAEGELVDLVGFPAIGGFTPTLTETIFRRAGGGQTLQASFVTAEQALTGAYDAQLITVEGKVIGHDRAAKNETMVLSSGKFLFQVVLPDTPSDSAPSWKDGSSLRVTGICSIQVQASEPMREGFMVPASFRILLRERNDVVTLRYPSWWTAAHLLPLLVAILAIVLCALGWVVVLRHRIADQAAVIREQNIVFKNLSFQDGLTQIPNRRKFEETLKAELERTSRCRQPLSLLILDIDHFKALNDQYGHQRGDECLVLVAQALRSVAIRPMDLVARYGGEEFAAILPECDTAGAVAIGEAMRAAVIHLCIPSANSPPLGIVSISVGVATAFPRGVSDAATLIGLADGALYRSKLEGRNRTTAAGGNGKLSLTLASASVRSA